ncbi:hypothetical protein J1605_019651 [Eschrichtius robustus]|uniref:Uncharacterized protein n=1 Tax=Eschrichtius robustus TaxID=9764 RepID=A0AB34HLI6_ESCRO|nr:hypothetical protein J1605_019651 [Eschrichtius robustus]
MEQLGQRQGTFTFTRPMPRQFTPLQAPATPKPAELLRGFHYPVLPREKGLQRVKLVLGLEQLRWMEPPSAAAVVLRCPVLGLAPHKHDFLPPTRAAGRATPCYTVGSAALEERCLNSELAPVLTYKFL